MNLGQKLLESFIVQPHEIYKYFTQNLHAIFEEWL